MDACTSGCRAVYRADVYHTIFPQCILDKGCPICKLEAPNATVAIKYWAPTLVGRRVRLYSESSKAVAILQAHKGSNSHIQACAREIRLSSALRDITLTCTHTPSVTVSSPWQMLLAGVISVDYIRIGYTSL